MPESQQDIDALLAEVNALAQETVAGISGSDTPVLPAGQRSAATATQARPRTTVCTDHPTEKSVSPLVKTGRIPGRGPISEHEHVSRILNIEVPIIVQLSERTMPLADILNLTTGSIIEFDKPADSELELKVSNKCIGSGQAVKVGENFGLRVVRVGTLRERIQALGGV